eukprot:7372713-Pyramimonas_sp.AAC.1
MICTLFVTPLVNAVNRQTLLGINGIGAAPIILLFRVDGTITDRGHKRNKSPFLPGQLAAAAGGA